jgi:hypothetical protein
LQVAQVAFESDYQWASHSLLECDGVWLCR